MSMSEESAGRCATLIRKMKKAGLSACLITKPENIHYICGFCGEDSWLVLGRKCRVLITDSRFTEEAGRSAPDFDVHLRRGGIAAETAEILKKVGGRIGFEANHLTVSAHEVLTPKRSKRYQLVAQTGLIEEMRLIKDAGEIAAIRRAISAAEDGLKIALSRTKKGASEAEFAATLDYWMREQGATGAAFPTIVAGEPLSSLPHATPTDARLYVSSTLLVDWGARVGYYNSDLTRVVAWGKVTPRIARIWGVVKAAQREALRTIRAGVSAVRVDAAARRVISQAGFGEFFGHGLGHGVGLEIHEGPTLSPRSKVRLKAGMVVTVEPGIYLPGIGGVRLEDMVLVTARGAEILTTVSRDPHVLGALSRLGK